MATTTRSRRRREGGDDGKRFATKMALGSTVFAMVLLLVLFVSFSEWRGVTDNNYFDEIEWDDLDEDGFDGSISEQQQSPRSMMLMHRHRRNLRQHRRLDSNEEDAGLVTNGNYSNFRCDDIFDNTPSINSTQSIPTIRCQYARTCENSGLLLPFIFCHNTLFSTSTWMMVLFPPLLLGLTLLFRLLGSTADEYFSPSLEMFSVKLGLPPRFAGVTLLALGNGASDVSATMNAIWNDPVDGYKLSLGALTGASMFITTVVAGSVILANGGMVCRGAMLRDVVALAVTVVVVALTLEGGEVDSKTESLFISIYVVYVLIVLFADVYHRAVMLPRIKHELEMREHARQIEAGRVASLTAGDAWGNLVGGGVRGGGDEDAISIASVGPLGGGRGGGRSSRPVSPAIDDDVRSHASAPPSTVACNTPIIKNRALNAVLTALSNYNDVEHDFDDVDGASHRPRQDGWGVESTIEGSMPWDRPVVLHGADGVLSRHPHHHVQPGEGSDNQYSSPYRVMEDMDVVERMCVPDGSQGHPALNWVAAWHEFRQELVLHFQECWGDIIDDDESSWLDKFLMICEYPVTVARKLTVSIPCEGSYCRALVALSFSLSPLWMSSYINSNFNNINFGGWSIAVYMAITCSVGLLITRYAPGGDGNMATVFAVPLALYGFIVAASWIDTIAENLVNLLGFLGIMLRIPNSIMGLTVLAWGNSMADWSSNVTMARKGLANMAITACFAGPVFNILIGLGLGLGALGNSTGMEVNYVHVSAAINIGFLFCFINCGLVLVSGFAINKGVIPSGYGYAALALYSVYMLAAVFSAIGST